jgi:hypothetical protein
MKPKPHSSFVILHSTFAFVAAITLITTAPCAPAQTPWGNALSFDGFDDYVQAGAVPLTNTSFTIEAWARRDTTGTMDMIVAQGTGGTGKGLMFGYHWFGFDFEFYGDPLTTTNIDNAWHHWAGTYNATNRLRCLYRDGVLMASNVAAQAFEGSGPLRIGGEPFADPASFAGAIDDVRIWNVARSEAEVAAHMSYPLTGAEPNLLAYWKFDEAGGADAFDATTNGYNGTLINGPQRVLSTIPQSWGNALSLNGNTQYVAMPAGTWFNGDLTIEAWVYERSYDNWARLLDFGNGQSSDNVILALSDGTTGKPSFGVVVTNTGYTMTAGSALPTNQWVHLAATLQGTNATIYVDGIPVNR